MVGAGAYDDQVASQLAAESEGVTVSIGLRAEDPIDRLRGLKTADDQLERWLVEAVGEARRAGRSWASIGAALGVSRQAAWELYNNDLREAVDEARARSGLDEPEAMALATEELRRVRSRRRR